MADKTDPPVTRDTTNDPVHKMTREQRLAFLEDLVVLLATTVVTLASKQKGGVKDEAAQVLQQCSVIVAQGQMRETCEQY